MSFYKKWQLKETYPLCGGLLNIQDFNSVWQMKFMSFIVCAEQGILCPWVNKLHPNIAGNRSFVFFHTKLGCSLLKYNLQKQSHEVTDVSNIMFTNNVSVSPQCCSQIFNS